MPIYKAHASVLVPFGAAVKQSACYYGPHGSTNKCQMVSGVGETYSFSAPGILNPGDGLTVAVGFSKGFVAAYTAADATKGAVSAYSRWLISLLLPLLTLIGSLWYWYRKGRDPKGAGVIVPQYDVPDGLTPMEVDGIVNENVDTRGISAQIIYLATKGYIKINQLEDRFIRLIKTTDYELVRLKSASGLVNAFDQKLLDSLFAQNVAPTAPVQSVKLSDLELVFYKKAAAVVTSVLDSLLNKGYYKNLGTMNMGGGRFVLIGFMAIWMSAFFGILFGGVLFGGNPFPIMVGIFASVIVYGVVSHFNPAKTEKGVATKEYLLGLKMYLQIAEKDRLQFHNAPEKKPEVFEALLPYAMVLGVATIWAKEFEGIYTVPPSWYSGPSGVSFSAITFAHTMTSFSSFAAGALSSAPHSSSGSGSGGGGFSGGGGGGGGGGSW
jgi:uncharacterized membrane protein